MTNEIFKGNRKDAIRAGEYKFYTGRPCNQGHLAFRYTNSGSCSECVNPKLPRRNAPLAPNQFWLISPMVTDTLRPADHPDLKSFFTAKALAMCLQWEREYYQSKNAPLPASATPRVPRIYTIPEGFQMNLRQGTTPYQWFKDKGWTDEQIESSGYMERIK